MIHKLGVYHVKPQHYSPPRSLPAALVCVCLLGLLAEASSAVRVLLAHGAPVGQIAGAVDDGNQCAYDWPVNAHVREDACCVGAAKGCHVELGSHDGGGGDGGSDD